MDAGYLGATKNASLLSSKVGETERVAKLCKFSITTKLNGRLRARREELRDWSGDWSKTGERELSTYSSCHVDGTRVSHENPSTWRLLVKAWRVSPRRAGNPIYLSKEPPIILVPYGHVGAGVDSNCGSSACISLPVSHELCRLSPSNDAR